MTNNADPDQLAYEDRVYLGSAGPGLTWLHEVDVMCVIFPQHHAVISNKFKLAT